MNWLPWRTERGEKASPTGITLGIKTLQDKGTGLFVARGLTADSQEITNLLDPDGDKATIGSTTGSDSNDPRIYTNTNGSSVFQFAKESGNSLETPSLSTTVNSSIQIVFDFGDRGFQESSSGFACPGGYAASLTSGIFPYHQTDGRIRVFGGATTSIDFTTTEPIPTGTKFLRLSLVMGKGVDVHLSSDGGSWTLHHAHAQTSLSAITSNLRAAVGSVPYSSSSFPFDSQVRSLTVYVDGELNTVISASDWVDAGTPISSFSASTGQTVSINRSSTGFKVVGLLAGQVVVQSNGTDSYVQLPASCTPTCSEAVGGYTVLQTGRRFGDSGGLLKRAFSAESANHNGLYIGMIGGTNPRARFGGSISFVTENPPGNSADGVFDTVGLRQDGGSLLAYCRSEGGLSSGPQDTTGVGTPTFSAPRIHSPGFTVSGANEDWGATAVFLQALTEAEMDAVAAYMESIV